VLRFGVNCLSQTLQARGSMVSRRNLALRVFALWTAARHAGLQATYFGIARLLS
jgi:hypothetical protein